MSASDVRTPTPDTSRTPLPSPTPVSPKSTPSPTATPLPLGQGPAITVAFPIAQQRIASPVRITGAARVFEGSVEAAVKDASGNTLGSGFTTASRGAPEWGSYDMELKFQQPSSDAAGKVEVFSRSARDGSIEVSVVVPVVLASR